MKVDGAENSLLQGVSQQPPRVRRQGQCTLQENMSSNPVEGLTRRIPSNQIAALFAANGHKWYNTRVGNKSFDIAIAAGDVKAVDISNGAIIPVNIEPAALPYISQATMAVSQFSGTTYISNPSVTPAWLNTTANQLTRGSIIFLLGGQYGRTYSTTITWSGSPITVSYTAPDGSSASHTAMITTENLATKLYDALVANGTFTANFSVTRVSDVLYIKKTSAPTDEVFSVTVSDGDGGANMFVVNNSVKDVGTLPRYAPQGYVLTVFGDGNADADDWYLEFLCDVPASGVPYAVGSGFGTAGKWIESTKPGVKIAIDPATMPHMLTYDEGTNSFTLKQGEWAGRQVGDEDSNPDPSFIGSPITGVSYFQDRLVVHTNKACIMSRTNKPLDFLRQSATVLAESDPIDFPCTSKNNTRIIACVPHNRDLVIFGDKGQFIVFGRNKLTPQNSSAVLTTEFESDTLALPASSGRVVFFPIKYGNYGNIREFFTESAEDVNDSRNITKHVPQYIQGSILQLDAASDMDLLVIRSSGDNRAIYAYEYTWQNQERVQSSFSKWSLHDPVEHTTLFGTKLYCITNVNGTYNLEAIDFDTNFDGGMQYQVKLDRRVIHTGVSTTISDPYPLHSDKDEVLFVQSTGCPNPGMRVTATYNAGVYTLDDDMLGGSVITGVRYTSRYQPTIPFMKDQEGIKIGTGKLVISKFFFNFKECGTFNAIITSPHTDPVSFEFDNRNLGTPSFILGEQYAGATVVSVPFRHDADIGTIELTTNSHLPLSIMDFEWIGQYNKTGRRVQ